MITNQIINKAIDFILSHIDEELSVERIADFCGYSKFYLSRLFKAETGESIYSFIKRTKVEQSAWRLKVEQDRSVTEIGGDYGYSASNYATLFRDVFYFMRNGKGIGYHFQCTRNCNSAHFNFCIFCFVGLGRNLAYRPCNGTFNTRNYPAFHR